MLVVMISQIHCFFSLFLDLSQFYFRNPPVLKINCLFSFSLQAHSFLHIVSLKCFSLLACFYFCVFVSMNEMWGNWVRNVLSTLTWRRNSIHCRSSSFQLNPARSYPKQQKMGPNIRCFQEAEYQGLCQEMATTSFPDSPVVKILCPQCRCEGS